ncbi:MAG TPA: PAS domain S-box protein [Thermodesulfovibrionales bacterium]|nr:PAS domain S-box protein [Thermodesulfovibrionales bacterium]
MRKTYTSRAELRRELEEMRQKLHEVEQCRNDFQNVRERYDRLLESAPDALIFVNRAGNIVFVNAQFERLFGYNSDEVTSKSLSMLIPERFHKAHRNHVADFFEEPRVRPMGSGLTIYALKQGGIEFPADISLSTLEAEGELLVTAAIRDITERRRAEELIERNYHIQRAISAVLKISLEAISLEEQMEKVLDIIVSIPGLALESKGAIYLVEDEPEVLVLKAPRRGFDGVLPCEKIAFGKCLCGNAAMRCETVFSDCIGDSHEVRFSDDLPHGHYCVPIVRGGRAMGLINILVREGHKRSVGEEEFLTSISRTLAGVIERYRTEHEKERLREQLAHAEQLTALGRVTASVADEIRNPLTSVGGFARRLRKKISEGAPEREYVELIISEVGRLEGILHDVLVFSRGGGPSRTETDIWEIVGDAVSFFEKRCRVQSIEIRRTPGKVLPVKIDREQVLEAVKNLMSNALDSMPDGGTLSISTSTELREDKRYVRLIIGDTGRGIPPQQMSLIFEPFYTTKLQPKGTGLGLPIAKKVIEDYGGFIQAESTPSGSVFILFFPAASGIES